VEHILLLSSTEITGEQFRAFLVDVGLELRAKPHQWFDATWTQANGKIWVALDNEQLEDIDSDDPELYRCLGGQPCSLISVELANALESRRLALEFACHVAERWPSVADDTHGRLYSARELVERRQQGLPI
jgi:hypothetical protein